MPPCRTHRATYEKFADGTSKDISDELPFDLPQGWAWARLEDVLISLHTGLNPRRFFKLNTPDAKNYYVTIRELQNNRVVTSSRTDRINDSALKLCNNRSNLELGDVLFGGTGSIGVTALITQSPDNWNIKEGVYALKPALCGLHPGFLLYLLNAEPIRKAYTAKAVGATVLSVPMKEMLRLLTPLPPLSEQKRIVKKIEELFAYSDAICNASEVITKTADRIDKKILDLAIRGQLVPQDPNDEPASELVKRIEASMRAKGDGCKSSRVTSDRPAYEIDPPFDIPDSWVWVKFGTLIQVIAGVSYQKDDVTTTGVRILRGGNIKEDARIYLHDDDVFLPATYAEDITSVKAGDIVVVASTGSSTVIGRPAVATETMVGVQIGAFLRIVRAVDDSIMSWLPVIFLGDYYRNFIRSRSKGTNIKNLKTEYLTELPVPLPPLAEQKRIVTKIKELRAMTKSLTT